MENKWRNNITDGKITIKSKKLIELFDEIGGILNISSYTENYLIYKFKLRKNDIKELEILVDRYDVRFCARDLIDDGLDKKACYILYKYGVYTTNMLYRKYNFFLIQSLPEFKEKPKLLVEITNFLNLN